MARSAFKQSTTPEPDEKKPLPQEKQQQPRPGYDDDDDWQRDKKRNPRLMPWHHPRR